MEISYRREMNHNYLMIEENRDEHGYAAKMMLNNPIEGLLRLRIKKMDVQSFFCYEITSKQPLGRLLEHRAITAEEIRCLLLEIASTINRMESFLLKEEEILLQPDFIYVDPDSFQPGLCLIPGRKADFPNDLSKLLEYLLGKVDYQDKDSVVMAYALYRESLKENYGMEDLLKLLFSKREDRQESEQDRKHGLTVKESTETAMKQEAEKGEAFLQKRENEWQKEKKGKQEEERKEKRGKKGKEEIAAIGFFAKFRQFFGFWEKEKKENTVTVNKQESWQMFFNDEVREDASAGAETKVKAEEGEETQTQLLFDAEVQKEKHRFVSLDPELSDIQIAYYPFLIGKQENLVDYVLNKDTVSRLHLRIDEEEGRYRITDLNSTNGIRVAGMRLENNETAEIQVGDEIEIANFHFRFA
ncbi:MAG: DUF6382 domain-containing protein [Hungatella sp.]